jgi:glyoxylase-like metal-dependent hydrolase (beta-lactamase superfamily II)
MWLGAGAASLLSVAGCRVPQGSRPRSVRVVSISPELSVVMGAVNTGLIVRNGGRLALNGDPRPDALPVERILFTHHRRDVIWAGARLAASGATITIPETERGRFTDTVAFWDFFARNRFHDYVQPSTKVSVEPWTIAEEVKQGSVVRWRGLEIRVLETPGYTPGAVTYLLELDGRRIGFCGDLIYGGGQVLDLYSLQDAIPEARALGYHGFMSRASSMIHSLRELADQQADLLVPSRGPIIERPQEAIGMLVERLQAVYRNYLSTTALRWDVPDRMPLIAGRVLGEGAEVDYLVDAEVRTEYPSWLRGVQNSRLLISDSRSAFLIDCGVAFEDVRRMLQSGEITSIEGIYVTHYHDDHTHHVQAASETFGCPVYACQEISDILRNPRAYRMPAQTPNAIKEIVSLQEGEVIDWREFHLTSYYFPGQTMYHGSLLVERDEERLYFIGDSFSPTGFSDSCPQNRIFVRSGTGFLRCIDRLAVEAGTFLVSQHVQPLFRFTPEQIFKLREACVQRGELLRALFPWDDPNFGLDEGWVRCYPYEVSIRRGEPVPIAVRILNHSDRARIYRIQPHAPEGWRVLDFDREANIEAGEEGELQVVIAPEAGRDPALSILTVGVAAEDFELVRWAEALLLPEPE